MHADELRTLFLQHINLANGDVAEVSRAFSALYRDFQTDVIRDVNCYSVEGTPYTWVDSLSGRSEQVILFFHGGGYTMGSTDDHLQLIASLVTLSGKSMLGVDYRLCPQHTFPAPLDDAERAYCWLLDQGYTSGKIGVSGISAGATLVTQLLHRCESKALDMPAVALVMAGVMDFTFERGSISTNGIYDIVSRERLEMISSLYLKDVDSRDQTDIYCIHQPYANYPRTLFQVGDREALLDDAVACHAILSDAGHDVSLHVVRDLIHCGQLFSSVFEPGQLALAEAGRFLQASFNGL